MIEPDLAVVGTGTEGLVEHAAWRADDRPPRECLHQVRGPQRHEHRGHQQPAPARSDDLGDEERDRQRQHDVEQRHEHCDLDRANGDVEIDGLVDQRSVVLRADDLVDAAAIFVEAVQRREEQRRQRADVQHQHPRRRRADQRDQSRSRMAVQPAGGTPLGLDGMVVAVIGQRFGSAGRDARSRPADQTGSALDLGPGLDPIDERHAVAALAVRGTACVVSPRTRSTWRTPRRWPCTHRSASCPVLGGDLGTRLRVGRGLTEVVRHLRLHRGTGDVVHPHVHAVGVSGLRRRPSRCRSIRSRLPSEGRFATWWCPASSAVFLMTCHVVPSTVEPCSNAPAALR